jgi:hypothetical protein
VLYSFSFAVSPIKFFHRCMITVFLFRCRHVRIFLALESARFSCRHGPISFSLAIVLFLSL